MNQVKYEIQNSLKQYGLNPMDWRVKPVHSRLLLIQNKEDHEIQILAKLGLKKDPSDQIEIEQLQFLPI